MALFITEFAAIANVGGNLAQIPVEPSIAVQVVEAAAASDPLSHKTAFVELYADEAGHYKVGEGELAAATTDTPIGAGQTKFFGVSRSGLLIAFAAAS